MLWGSNEARFMKANRIGKGIVLTRHWEMKTIMGK